MNNKNPYGRESGKRDEQHQRYPENRQHDYNRMMQGGSADDERMFSSHNYGSGDHHVDRNYRGHYENDWNRYRDQQQQPWYKFDRNENSSGFERGGNEGGRYGYGGSSGKDLSNDNFSRRSEQSRGGFFGKGPKGYKRSDERIREDVCECLARHDEIDASEIDVKVENGEVTLSGSVQDRHTKRMAEDEVEKISGITDVRNEIRVNANNSSSNSRTEDPQSDSSQSKGSKKQQQRSTAEV